MSEKPLRPVGTEFWGPWLPAELDGSPHPRRALYRVVEYVRVARYDGDTEGEPAERVETVRIEEQA